MRGKRSKAIRHALAVKLNAPFPRKVPLQFRTYEQVPTTQRTRTVTNIMGVVTGTYDTWTLKNKAGSPRSVLQRTKRRYLA